jgi:hypothetical protein
VRGHDGFDQVQFVGGGDAGHGVAFSGNLSRLRGESATKSDSIDGHYVAQCVALASHSVVAADGAMGCDPAVGCLNASE